MGWMGSCIFLVVSCCRKSILRNLICRKSIQVTMCIRGCKSPLFSKDLKASSYISVELVLLVLYFYVLLFLLASFMWGGITLVIVMFGGLGITSQLQRKGLHRKDKRKGIYIVSRTFVRDRKK